MRDDPRAAQAGVRAAYPLLRGGLEDACGNDLVVARSHLESGARVPLPASRCARASFRLRQSTKCRRKRPPACSATARTGPALCFRPAPEVEDHEAPTQAPRARPTPRDLRGRLASRRRRVHAASFRRGGSSTRRVRTGLPCPRARRRQGRHPGSTAWAYRHPGASVEDTHRRARGELFLQLLDPPLSDGRSGQRASWKPTAHAGGRDRGWPGVSRAGIGRPRARQSGSGHAHTGSQVASPNRRPAATVAPTEASHSESS